MGYESEILIDEREFIDYLIQGSKLEKLKEKKGLLTLKIMQIVNEEKFIELESIEI